MIPVLPRKLKYKVVNIVASASLDQTLDLNAVARADPRADYDPSRFPGLVYRIDRPKVTVLVFSTGKMICTGAKNEREVYVAVRRVVRSLRRGRVLIPKEVKVEVQNVVAFADLGVEVNLEKAAFTLEGCVYEPDQFPGLIHKVHGGSTLLIFASGKVVCVGAKSKSGVEKTIAEIYEKLRRLNVLYR